MNPAYFSVSETLMECAACGLQMGKKALLQEAHNGWHAAQRRFTIPLPWPKPPLTQNDRNDRRTGGARKIKAALEQARWAIRAAQVPSLAGAEVDVHWRIPTKGRRDSDNLAPTLKVCQDALVQEGVLPDDSWVCVPRSGQAIHPPTTEPAAMWLELTNVTPMETRP